MANQPRCGGKGEMLPLRSRKEVKCFYCHIWVMNALTTCHVEDWLDSSLFLDNGRPTGIAELRRGGLPSTMMPPRLASSAVAAVGGVRLRAGAGSSVGGCNRQ